MRVRRNNILVLIFICALGVNSGYGEPNEPRTYVLATGSESGVYYKLGLGIQEAFKEDTSIRIEVVSTKGAMENLEWLEEKFKQEEMKKEGKWKEELNDKNTKVADLAFTQNNIAHWFYHGEKLWALPSKTITGVASLYTESIQIIVWKDLNVREVGDLRDRTVCTRPNETRKFSAATDILSAAGLEHSDVTQTTLPMTEACEAVENPNDATEAAFIIAGIPTPGIKEVYKRGQIRFIELPKKLARSSYKSCPYLVYDSIPAGTYIGQNKEISTLGVRALLVARKNLEPEVVRKVAAAIFEKTAILKNKHRQGENITVDSATKGMTIDLHQGANEYLESVSFLVKLRHQLPKIINYIFSVGIILFLSYYIVRRRFVPKALGKNVYTQIIIVFFCLYALGAIFMVLYEGPVNEHFGNLYQSFWSIFMYLASGFEDHPPVTRGGTIAAGLIIFFLGAGFGGIITGKFAAVFLTKEKKMPPNIKMHVVICNWNKRGHKIVEQLHRKEAAPSMDIVIVTDSDIDEEKLRKNNSKTYDNVYIQKGCPDLLSVLESCRIHLAKSVIILADDEHCDEGKPRDPDDKSVDIALAIKIKLEEKLGVDDLGRLKEPEPHIAAEVLDYEMVAKLKAVGVHETVCATELGLGVLAQCAVHHNLSNVYGELLDYSPHTNEIYVIVDKDKRKIPGICANKTFEECANIINKHRGPQSENPAILLGVYRDNKILLNPRKESGGNKAFERIKKDDGLVVMAFSPPNLAYLTDKTTTKTRFWGIGNDHQ